MVNNKIIIILYFVRCMENFQILSYIIIFWNIYSVGTVDGQEIDDLILVSFQFYIK